VAKTATEVPEKLFYKIGEVCEITDTQPYVLRFWESEFPQLSPKKNRSGQRVYQRKDIDTVVRIKQLLYEEEYTIAGARKKLEEEMPAPGDPGGDSSAPGPSRPARRQRAAREKPVKGPLGEVDHPVDLLQGRPSDREKRMEKALAELKGSLEELLAILRKS